MGYHQPDPDWASTDLESAAWLAREADPGERDPMHEPPDEAELAEDEREWQTRDRRRRQSRRRRGFGFGA